MFASWLGHIPWDPWLGLHHWSSSPSNRPSANGRLRPVSPRPQSSRSSFWTERTDFAFVQRDAFPYRLYSPRSMVASPSQNRLWADTYPALRTSAGPAPRPHGHSLAILFRFFFDPLRTRPGTGRVEWRGLGAGRDRGMYQISGRRGVVRLSRQRRNERGESDRSGGRSRRCPRAIEASLSVVKLSGRTPFRFCNLRSKRKAAPVLRRF